MCVKLKIQVFSPFSFIFTLFKFFRSKKKFGCGAPPTLLSLLYVLLCPPIHPPLKIPSYGHGRTLFSHLGISKGSTIYFININIRSHLLLHLSPFVICYFQPVIPLKVNLLITVIIIMYIIYFKLVYRLNINNICRNIR